MSKKKASSFGITRTWISAKHSITLVVPRRIAIEHGLASPAYVTVQTIKLGENEKGILIRKLKLDERVLVTDLHHSDVPQRSAEAGLKSDPKPLEPIAKPPLTDKKPDDTLP